MFKIVPQLAVWWPVTVLEPDNDNPGTLKEQTFEAEFLIRGREEAKALQDERNAFSVQLPGPDDYAKDFAAASAKAAEINKTIEAHDRKVFHLSITNWRGVTDANDNPMSFTADALDMALNLDRVRLGIAKAYEDAVSNDKARLGNSKA